MKSTILAVPILIAAMSGTTALAQDIPATAPTASAQSDPADDDFAENRRTCLQQARQTANPQERQRLIQRCQQDFPSGAKTMPAPATPPSATPPQVPDTAESTGNAPDSMATPMSPDTRTDPARTLSPSEMSPEERREQRRLRREQRRLARQQAMQAGEFDDDGSYDNSFRGGRQRAWPAQNGGGYAWVDSSDNDDGFTDESVESDFGGRSGSETPPGAGNWQSDYAGRASRGQRIRRLEQRLEVIEDLLRQILANQRQLLNR